MIRSMSSAISGMKNHQLMLDVVGNDLANVSTSGYKSSDVVFTDVLSQTLAAAGAPGDAAAVNPTQVGLGARVAGTVQSFVQGALQRTGRATDLAIEGDGFFVVDAAGQQGYTRSGAFGVDATGVLVSADGGAVLGWTAAADGTVDTGAAVGRLRIPLGTTLPPQASTAATIGGNLPAGAAAGDTVALTLTAVDDQGTPVRLHATFTKGAAAGEWTVTATHGDPPVAVPLTGATLTFDSDGELTAPASRSFLVNAGAVPGLAGELTVALGAAGQAGRLTQFAAPADVAVVAIDGAPASTLDAFTIDGTGSIIGTTSQGSVVQLGRIALATFANAQGLERSGGRWTATAASGAARLGTAGTDGLGSLAGGALEMSNVDMAEEFSQLIVAQRGFQGNARVITAADELLQEIVRIGR